MNERKEFVDYLLIALRLLAFWTVTCGAAFVAAGIQLKGKTDTGKETSASFFSGTMYRYETGAYIIGAVLFLVILFAAWWFIVRRLYCEIVKVPLGWKIACIVISAAGVDGTGLSALFALFANLGMADNIEPGILMAVTAYGWPVIALGLCVGGLVWHIRKEG